MRRRHFLQLTPAIAATLRWKLAQAGKRGSHASSPCLVLVELAGGNDGLNTIVPYRDPVYYRLRPTLAVPTHNVVPLGARLGLHPALKEL